MQKESQKRMCCSLLKELEGQTGLFFFLLLNDLLKYWVRTLKKIWFHQQSGCTDNSTATIAFHEMSLYFVPSLERVASSCFALSFRTKMQMHTCRVIVCDGAFQIEFQEGFLKRQQRLIFLAEHIDNSFGIVKTERIAYFGPSSHNVYFQQHLISMMMICGFI